MAIGIPTNMSPVGVNGFLADTTEDWVSFLSALIEDGDLRKRLGEAASITVEERYSKNAVKDLCVDVFEHL